jgi:glycosyltransferase involved in cell wall biosynthesis
VVRSYSPWNLDPRVEVVSLGSRNTLVLVLRLMRYLRERTPINLLTFSANAISIAGLANLLSGKTARFVINESVDPLAELRNTRWSAYKVALLLIPLTYRLADVVTAVSDGVARSLSRLTRMPRSTIRVIHSPAYEPSIELAAAHSLDHRWDSPEFSLVVAACRLTAQKDLATLLRAFQLVVSSDPRARLIVLGDGPQRRELELLRKTLGLDDFVDMPGTDPNPYRWFARCRLFVLSSAWEGFGAVLVEALACGCAVVSTDCPSGPAEILNNGEFGRLTPVGDANAMSVAILEALTCPSDPEHGKRRAREFSLDRALDQFSDTFYLPEAPR